MNGSTLTPTPPVVRRRLVCYLSGFDPKGANYYHGLFREEAGKAAARLGWEIDVSARRKLNGDTGWKVESFTGEEHAETDYRFLHWDDIVRENWPRKWFELWWLTLVTTWFNLRQGSLWRMYRLAWPPALALFLPFVLVVLQILGGIVAPFATAIGWAGGALTGVSMAYALAIGAAIFALARVLDTRYSMYWLMRSYAFTRRQLLGQTPGLDARLDRHAKTLCATVRDGLYDEVLVVGHSTGGNMAVSVLARALTLDPGLFNQPTRVALLTLGNWIPLMSTPRSAEGFRRELATVASGSGLTWLDFSAPPDGCCFALVDPLSTLGETACSYKLKVKNLNPRLAELYTPASYAALKKVKLDLHFAYLLSPEFTGEYDYFQIICGPTTLADRFSSAQGVKNYRTLRGLRWLT